VLWKYRKYLIRNAFSSEEGFWNSKGEPLLPDKVLWRRKEAFSDGVSKQSRSLYEIIQEHALLKFIANDLPLYPFIEQSDNMYEHITKLIYSTDIHLIPKTAEQFLYRKIFEFHYPEMAHIIPYFWMPKFVNATDASARTLDIYNANDSV